MLPILCGKNEVVARAQFPLEENEVMLGGRTLATR